MLGRHFQAQGIMPRSQATATIQIVASPIPRPPAVNMTCLVDADLLTCQCQLIASINADKLKAKGAIHGAQKK